MALPISIPYTFANATTSIPLSQLDTDISTIYATVNGIGNGTVALANVVITGGIISNVSGGLSTSSIANGTSNVSIAAANGSVTVATAGTTAMTVDTSQNVGIGTSSPSSRLQVSNGASGLAEIQLASNVQAFSIGTGGSTSGYGVSALYFYDKTANAERMRIDSSGNLLVGMTTASAKFAISSGATASISATNTNANDFFVANMNQGNSSSTALYVMPMRFGNNTLAGSIYWNGTAVLFQGTSDYRMKKDVSLLTDGLSRINSLKPSSYTWIEQNLPGEGFIAHELQEVIPSAVTGQKDAINEDGTIHPQQVDMSRIVPHLVAAIQELSAKNDALEARLAALEAK